MIQKKQMEILELKNVITKIKNSISGLSIKMQGIEERISELPNRTIEITQFGQQRENRLKKRNSLRDLWDCDKRSNTCVIRVPEGKEKLVRAQKVCKEIMSQKFPN